jgi:hypothetical protein
LKWAGRKAVCQIICKIGIYYDRFAVSKIDPATKNACANTLFIFLRKSNILAQRSGTGL